MDSPRILSQPEIDATWSALARQWDIPSGGSRWFPLESTTCPAVVAFEAPAFDAALGPAWLREVLAERGVDRVLHFPEFTEIPVAEISLASAAFRYEQAEGYWCDARAPCRDWLVYASHEDSVTLGGAWLIAAAQRAWPDWSAHLWNYTTESYRPVAS